MQERKKIYAIVQARIGSTRLPGKVLKPLCGKPMLWHLVNRLKHSKEINEIIIATTVLHEDDVIANFCLEHSINFSRGSSEDVLSRYYESAKKYNAEIIIRVTADCPVIDPAVVDRIIDAYLKEKVDYMSNSMVRTFPRGLDTEIFPFEILERTYNEATKEYEREHVTPYIYNHPEIFSLKSFLNSKDLSFHRWTVDTKEDFKLIEEIYNSLFSKKEVFLLEDILKLFEERPELFAINQNVQQKKLGE